MRPRIRRGPLNPRERGRRDRRGERNQCQIANGGRVDWRVDPRGLRRQKLASHPLRDIGRIGIRARGGASLSRSILFYLYAW
eukprot:38388-Pyramimonas_sp.AAC.1